MLTSVVYLEHKPRKSWFPQTDIDLYLDLIKKVDENVSYGFWMGANDLEREGFYVWLDGSEGKFTINTCKKKLTVMILNYFTRG